MEGLLAVWNYLQPKLPLLLDAVAYLVLFASIIVKITPTLKDDAYLKGVIKFIGKYIALDKYGPNKDA